MTCPWPLTQAARFAQLLVDLVVLVAAYFLAYVLRFEGSLGAAQYRAFACSVGLVVLGQYLGLILWRVPRSPWRFVSLVEGRRIGVAMGGVTLLVLGVNAAARFDLLPPALASNVPSRRLIFLDLLLGVFGLLGVRASVRLWMERRPRWQGGRTREAVPTLLIGAGRAGVAAVRQILAHPRLGIEPVGFLDDDPRKRGLHLHGLRVLGTVAEASKLVRLSGARQALITIGNLSGEDLHRIVEACRKCGIATKVIPGIRHVLEHRAPLPAIRDVAIEDLLGREPVRLELETIAAFVRGQCILVTGAGGSIGSELCRTVCRFRPARLVLVEHAENSLFFIHRELISAYPDLEVIPCLADICESQRMEQIFGAHRPDMVLHAAAHKHVPMIEWNPGEAIKNNVLGTRLIARLAHTQGVKEFVMISTDKAVNPTSIMGASKRIAEIYIQALSQHSQTRYVTVRFGNVLGSAGSVIPIFKEQIARGGPVTVTDPEMKRYFMTIPEACQLVLQAASMGQGGEIFILDMGQPVKIVDLARKLITLSGFGPEDIPINFTGVRPGEKLFEELALDDEIACKTRHPKIFIGRLKPADWTAIDRAIEEIRALADDPDILPLIRKLAQIVPEYEGHQELAVRCPGRDAEPPKVLSPSAEHWTPGAELSMH